MSNEKKFSLMTLRSEDSWRKQVRLEDNIQLDLGNNVWGFALNWLRIGFSGGLLWTLNEPFDSTKGEEFLGHQRYLKFVKNASVL
jgi:hypothetical protein